MKIGQKLQQGDVVLKKVRKSLKKGEELGHLTLAEGEATGHSHRITDGLAKLIMLDKIMHLQVFSKEATLKHETHGDIKVKEGTYEIGIVKEVDHFEDVIREVAD